MHNTRAYKISLVCVVFMFRKAFAAIDRSVMARLKRDLIDRSAGGTYDLKQLTLRSHTFLSCSSAFFAPSRFVFKALFGIKFLLSGGKNKFTAAVSAYQCLVLIHYFLPLCILFIQANIPVFSLCAVLHYQQPLYLCQ